MLGLHLESKVGRRLFVRFVLAAMLPVGALALYAYSEVVSLVTETHDHHLRRDSKGLGMNLIRELNWRAELLMHYPVHQLNGEGVGVTPPEGFIDLTLMPASTSLGREYDEHLQQGRAMLVLEQDNDVGMFVHLAALSRTLFARVDPGALWINDQAAEHYCILGMDLRPHHCSEGMQVPAADALATILNGSNGGNFAWSASEDLRGGFWLARLEPAYAHPGFIVLVAESRDVLTRNISRFRLVFFATAVLAFGLALLLASSQIRRQLMPLERLSHATRRVAAGDFSTPTIVQGDDEFASLSRSFNLMSENLKSKFHMLQMLGELDRAILRASEMSFVIDAVLGHLRESIACDGAGLIRCDAYGGARLLTAKGPAEEGDSDDARAHANINFTLSRDDASDQGWVHIDARSERPVWLELMSTHQRLEHALLFPVRTPDHPDSFLVLAFVALPDPLDDVVEAGGNLADRLSVAGANIAWEERLYHQGHYDHLTDLPNRSLLRARAEHALAQAQRDGGAVAVLLVDLDNFKEINDSLGHTAGDELLIECGRRLKAITRESDTVARLGGDEFVMLVSLAQGVDSPTHLAALARKINVVLAEPVLLGKRRISSPASVGIAVYPDNGENFEALLQMADAAMYESKRELPGTYRFSSGLMNTEVHERFELTQDLREAVSSGELLLYYQPKVSASSGEIVGAEALVRWDSPKRGFVPAGLFVTLLDDIGFGDWLCEWALNRACAQMAEWDRLGLPPVPVSVNISPRQFVQGNLIEIIETTLVRHAVSPDRLEIELLEDIAANMSSDIQSKLERLRAMGISIAMDDFGTGYSSLVYLTQLPVNVLKLDRAFICNLTTDQRQLDIVRSIISLARALNLQVVAEGVEEQQQWDLLAGMGCHLIQGYLISRPVHPDAFAELLRASANDPEPA